MGNYLLGTSTMIERASVRNSIIRREVVIEPDVELADCIIMDYVRICRGQGFATSSSIDTISSKPIRSLDTTWTPIAPDTR